MSQQDGLTDWEHIDVKRLQLEPGDIIVVSLDEHYADIDSTAFDAFADGIKEKLGERVPGHEFIVLGPGVDMYTMRPDGEGNEHQRVDPS